MKRNPTIRKFNVGTSKHDLLMKPYGFCCDIKDHDPALRIKEQDSEPLFSNGATGGGPDIKFRIQDADTVSPSAPRSVQKSAQRSGHRSGYRSGHRSGQQTGQESRRRSVQQTGHESRRRSGQQTGHESRRRSGQQSGHGSGHRRNHRSGRQRGLRDDELVNQDDHQPRRQSLRQQQGRGNYRNVNPRTDGDKRITPDESLDEPMICTRCRGPLRWYLEDEIAVARDVMMSRRQQEYNAEIDANVKIAMEKERRRRRKRKEKLKGSHSVRVNSRIDDKKKKST